MSELVISNDQKGFTPQQVAVLRQLGVDRASDGDLAVFFHQCVRTGLDPFAKQIYMVGRWDSRANTNRYTIQTGIDGYRLIADRTGAYAGSDESWQESNGVLVSSTVTVHKIIGGTVCNFTATAHFSEYVQTGKEGKPMGLWAKMPHRMLAKCAEALALRKAFPQDLSGLYTAEEMSQADNTVTVEPVAPAPQAIPANVVYIDQEREKSKAAHPSSYEPADAPIVALGELLKGSVDVTNQVLSAPVAPTATATVKKPSAAQVTLMNKLAKERGLSDSLGELLPAIVDRQISSIDELTSSEAFKVNNYLMNLKKDGQ